MPTERLQKIIAAAGIASRRKAEEMIQAGLVAVNGTIVTELGSKADPETDSIRVNNKLLSGPERHEYIVMNKPKGYVTTVSDPEGRPTVMELVHTKARLYPIGRLDFNSEGLLLLTNDGELAHKLMKAASHIPKTYLVKVAGQPAEDQLRRLRAGVSIAEERDPKNRVKTAPAQIRVIKEAENPWLEVTLHEGRNRQIRKMFEEVGHHVEKIRRVRYGPLELDLPPGESRSLTAKEVARLQHATTPEAISRVRPERRPFVAGDKRVQTPRPPSADRDRPFAEADNSAEARPGFSARAPRQGPGERPARFGGRPGRDRGERPAARFGERPRRAEGRAESKRFERPRRDDRPPRDDRPARRPQFAGRFQRDDRNRRPSGGDAPVPRDQREERPRRFADERGPRSSDRPRRPDDRKDRATGFDKRRSRPRSDSGPRFGAARGEGSERRPRFAPRGRNEGRGGASNRGRTSGGQRPNRGKPRGRT